MEQVIFFFNYRLETLFLLYDSNLLVKEIKFLLTTGGERDTLAFMSVHSLLMINIGSLAGLDHLAFIAMSILRINSRQSSN